MKYYKLVNNDDPNNSTELESTVNNEAYIEALDLLGYYLVECDDDNDTKRRVRL